VHALFYVLIYGDKYSSLLMTPLSSLLPQSSRSKTSAMQDHENMDNLQGSSKSDNKSEKVKDTPKLTRHGHEIPRPKNCFLAYRMEVASALVESGVDNNIPNISKLVADLWRTEPEAVKQRYREIAAKEKKEHKQL
jgi:predicted ATP-dependent endonuclease of OLD family